MDFNEYQDQAMALAMYKNKDWSERDIITYLALKLNGEAGEVAEHIGKAYRDDDGITNERNTKLLLELGDVLWYVVVLAGVLGYDAVQIMEENVQKLESRRNRGTLHGSGDNR